MSNSKKIYITTTYNVSKATFVVAPIWLAITFAFFSLGMYFHQNHFAVVGIVLTFVIPFFFKKKFKLLFTRKIILNFDIENFKISEFGLQDDELKSEFIYRWDEIKAYKCYFSASSVTFITLYLRDGSSKNLSFNDKDQKTAVIEESVFSLFYSFITGYNLNKDADNKIVFRPGFFTTNAGLTLIVSLLILAIILIIIHFVFHPKTAMMSLAGLFVILGLFGKRKKDIMFKDRLASLEPIKLDNYASL